MSIPEPFTPIALTAGILANIATDILRRHAQALEGTLVGRMLKLAGLTESDCDDRMQGTLSEALQVYFQTYPQYNLTGIAAFFRDQITAQQIGGYILDRKPIDQEQIQQTLNRPWGSNGVTSVWIKQHELEADYIVPDFLECYRRMLTKGPDASQILEYSSFSCKIDFQRWTQKTGRYVV